MMEKNENYYNRLQVRKLSIFKEFFRQCCKKYRKKITVSLSNKPDEVIKADKVILPGVGDFSNCKEQLSNISGMIEAINYYIKKKANPLFWEYVLACN